MRNFSAYAGPSVWGPWVIAASHTGSVTYSISVAPVGDTVIRSRVRYFKGANGGSQTIEEFGDSTSVTTSDSVANVAVSFMGVPTGSAIHGTISP